MGLPINVYRQSVYSDCTNGGISSQSNMILLINVAGPFEPEDHDYPPAMLVAGNGHGTLKIVPAIFEHGLWQHVPQHTMMGGNYGASPDSRFAEVCERILGHRFYGAVAIHDRIE